jgi:hypothetical protein
MQIFVETTMTNESSKWLKSSVNNMYSSLRSIWFIINRPSKYYQWFIWVPSDLCVLHHPFFLYVINVRHIRLTYVKNVIFLFTWYFISTIKNYSSFIYIVICICINDFFFIYLFSKNNLKKKRKRYLYTRRFK